MVEKDQQQQITRVSGREHHRQLSGRTIFHASMAGAVLGGPLLGLMGLSLLGTLALLIFASPLLLLSLPVLAGAALVVAAFSAAGAMAVAGLAAFGWAFKQARPGSTAGLATRVVDKFVGDESQGPMIQIIK